MSVEKFSSIFAGLDKAYGVYKIEKANTNGKHVGKACLLNTSPSPRDVEESRMPSSA